MLKIKKRYIVNEKNQPVQVVLDLATFKRIEELLEDQLLGRILEKENSALLPLDESAKQYARMKKRK